MDPSYRHLAFLLSLGGVPLACAGDDGASGSDSETTGASATTTATTTDATATTGDTSTSSTGTSTETGTSTGTTTTTTGETSDSGETTGAPGSACEDYASKYIECFPRYTLRDAVAYCEESRAAFVDGGEAGCADAFDALYVCLAGMPCDELAGQEQADLCPDLYDAMINTCLGVGELCAAFADKYSECTGESDPLSGVACQMELNYAGEVSMACGEAQEELFACLAGLDCADFDNGVGCESEGEALDLACG